MKGFCSDRGSRLVVFDRRKTPHFPSHVRKVAFEWDFNRVDIDGYPPDVVEAKYSAFEGKASQALRRIDKHLAFDDPQDRTVVFNFITLLAVCNPRMRKIVSDSQGRLARHALKLALKTPAMWKAQVSKMRAEGYWDGKEDVPYETLRNFSDRCTFKTSTTSHVKLENELRRDLLPYIAGRRWTLMVAGSDSGGFVTSDHPVCLMPPTGFGLRDTVVLFPLTQKLSLYGAFTGRDQTINSNIFTVSAINSAVITYAEHQVYAKDTEFAYFTNDASVMRQGHKLLDDPKFRDR